MSPSQGKGEIVSTLLALEREKVTGALDFRAQGVLTRIFVDGGVPIFAEAGVLGETLGNVLVREGILTSEQFAAVVRKMTDAIVDDESVRFGEVIVELGIMTQAELEAALATQVEKKIIGCIPRGEGDWSFEARSLEVARHRAPIRTLLVDAAKLLPQERLDAALKLDQETFPRLTESVAKVADEYGLEKEELATLDHLDGSQSTKALIAAARDIDTLLVALSMGGSLELLGAAQKKVVAPPSPLTATGRRRAFRAKLAPNPKGREAVERISREMAATDIARPQAISARQATLFAEDEFQTARRLFLQGKMEQAQQKLELAIQRSPAVPLYRLYEDFIASRIHGRFADAVGTKKRAVQMVKEDAECAFGYHVLAYLALEEGSHEQAKRFFRHAFKLDHELVDAGRQARLLEMRGEGQIHVPTPLKEIMPRAVVDPRRNSGGGDNKRTLILAGVLAVVIVVAVIVVVVLGH